MKKLVLAGLALAILSGCGFQSIDGQIRHGGGVPVTRPPHREQSYCFIPEGCDVNGHHYEGGQRIHLQDT
jgi:hypothetical protein